MSYEKLGFVSNQVLKAEHLNHMEDGIANISWNDLQDKPFGAEVTEVELLPKTTFDFDNLEDGRARIDPIELVAGETYLVTWDGKEYNSKAIEFFGGAIAIGNVYTITDGEFGAESTGEPFFVTTDGKTLTMIASIYDYGIHTISISKRAEIIKPIDNKYLPEQLQFGITVSEEIPTFDGDLTSKEYYTLGNDIYFVKASDTILTAKELIGSKITVYYYIFNKGVREFEITEEMLESTSLSDTCTVLAVGVTGDNWFSVFNEELMGIPAGSYYVYHGDIESGLCDYYTASLELKPTIKTIDEKYLPAPKLLGEITLTSENCTTEGDSVTLYYNQQLIVTMTDLLNTAKEANTVLCVLGVADVRYKTTTTIAEIAGSNYLYCSAYYSSEPLHIFIGETYAEVGAFIYQAVMGGHPMTIKVYAT